MANEEKDSVNEIDHIDLAEAVADKTNLDYAVEDADEIMEKLSEYGGGDFSDNDTRKLFRQWLIEKIESIMDQMDQ